MTTSLILKITEDGAHDVRGMLGRDAPFFTDPGELVVDKREKLAQVSWSDSLDNLAGIILGNAHLHEKRHRGPSKLDVIMHATRGRSSETAMQG